MAYTFVGYSQWLLPRVPSGCEADGGVYCRCCRWDIQQDVSWTAANSCQVSLCVQLERSL